MIVAIEGVDCSGKTTLFDCLREHLVDAKFVPSISMHPALKPHASLVLERQAKLWTYMYDSRSLYVCDRHFAVSGPVYDTFYRRTSSINYSVWERCVLVVYMHCEHGELYRRHLVRGDEDIGLGDLQLLQDLYVKRVLKTNWMRRVMCSSVVPMHKIVEHVVRNVKEARCLGA